MFYGLRLLSATGTVGGICLKKRDMTGSRTGEKEGIAQSADHDFLPVKTFFVQQCEGRGSFSVQQISTLAAVKGTGLGAASVISSACLAQVSAFSLSAFPWWPGIHIKVVCKRLTPEVSAEQLGSH